MECPRCGGSIPERDAFCPQCAAGTEVAWPPPPLNSPSVQVAPTADPIGEALHLGWRLLLLSAFCAPPVFLPLAIWQGIQANRHGTNAGNLLLIVCAGVGTFWLGTALLWLRFGRGL